MIGRSLRAWIVLAIILGVAVALVWFAPTERSLGEGIRFVYLHVALIWTGMTGLALAGLLGIVALLPGQERFDPWMRAVGRVGLAFFVAGFVMSMAAAMVNWGAVDWREPRAIAALNVVALALIVRVLNSWMPWIRVRALLNVILAAFLFWAIVGTPLVLHPRDPIRTSSSSGIQLSFLGLFGLACLAAGWIVWYLRKAYGRR